MPSEEDKKGAHAPTGEPHPPSDTATSETGHAELGSEHPSSSQLPSDVSTTEHTPVTSDQAGHSTVSYTPTVDDAYGSYDDPYGYDVHASSSTELVPAVQASAPPPPPP